MEEKKGTKVSLLSIVLIIILFVMVAGMVYLYLQNKKLNEKIIASSETIGKSDNETTEKLSEISSLSNQIATLKKELAEKDEKIKELAGNTTNSNVVSNTINKIDTSKDLIYTVTKTVKDNQGKDIKCEIPQINLNYDSIKKINEKIIEEMSKSANGTGFLPKTEYYEKDNLISLFVSIDGEGGSLYNYMVYNIDKNTGKELTNEEFWKINNITGKDIINKMKSHEKSRANDLRALNSSLDINIGPDNKHMSAYELGSLGMNIDIYTLPVFLNKKGNVQILLEELYPAGSGYGLEIVEL